jgi:hypothetical protein
MRIKSAAGGFFAGIILTALAFGTWSTFGDQKPLRARTLDAPVVVHEIQGLDELVSVNYTVQKVVGLEEKKRPLGSERLLLFVQAAVLAGVDLSKVTASDVKILPGRSIRLTLPPPRIVHIVIDDTQTKVWDRQITWWTPWVPFNKDLERQARLAARDTIERAAIEMGILDQAQKNAAAGIRSLLETLGVKSVVIEQSLSAGV